MHFEVYCDESRPEVFTSRGTNGRLLMIGSLWLPKELRVQVKEEVKAIRQRWGVWGEIKWSKVSPSKLSFYESVVDLFLSYGDQLRFRCIAVDADQVNMDLHNDDAELGFYKFYYQLLHHWIYDFNSYSVFCDTKSNRDPDRLAVLRDCLDCANLSSEIACVQALPSREVVPIQIADLLLGMAGARLNNSVVEGGAKDRLIRRLEERLGLERIAATPKDETKFNVFRIRLAGGW